MNFDWKIAAAKLKITLAGEQPTQEEMNSINAKIDEVAASNEALTAQLNDEKTAHTSTKDLLKTANDNLKTSNEDLATAKAKITEYETTAGKRGANEKPLAGKEGEKQGGEESEFEKLTSGFAHNKTEGSVMDLLGGE